MGPLFSAASQTLLRLGEDPKWLGGRLAFTAVLHTWTRELHYHPHLHCIVAAGALVPPDREIPDGSVVMGTPARAVRSVTEADLALISRSAANYRERVGRYLSGLQPQS